MVDILTAHQIREKGGSIAEPSVNRSSSKLQRIFGLPPWNIEPRTNEMMLNSMPVAEIIPSEPQFEFGMDLFRLRGDWDTYASLLKSYGFEFEPGVKSVKVAFLADSFPTDTFQNEYGENFLQKLTSGVSEGAASLAQIMGVKSGQAAFNKLQGALESSGVAGKMIGGAMGKGADMIEKFLKAAPGGGAVSRFAGVAGKLLAGARIDFPQVWKTSSFTPSYTMTVRLYNPDPRSDFSTQKYIIGPLAAIMLLGLPRSVDGGMYNWPFLHKIRAVGLYDLDPAFIGSITVVKGGDQQQISYNQRLGMVDVRIDFGSLYSSLIAGRNITAGRPTLKKYIDALSGKRSVTVRTGDKKIDKVGTAMTTQLSGTVEERESGQVNARNDEADVIKTNTLLVNQPIIGGR